MRVVGYMLFLAGTAAAAVIAASPRPLSACFIAAAAVGAAGALLVRFRGRSPADGASVGRGLPAVMFPDIASDIVASTGALRRGWDHRLSGGGERIHAIEEVMRTCNRFVESQDALGDSIGPARSAEVISSLAAGERYMHRAWSAQVDGCGDEALASLRAAESHFTRALELLLSGQGSEPREG
jgi:hypothetical protein